MKRKPYDYDKYLRNSKEEKYPLGLHEDIPMSNSYCMLISPQRREIQAERKRIRSLIPITWVLIVTQQEMGFPMLLHPVIWVVNILKGIQFMHIDAQKTQP
jgi:hypothetical protein